MFSFFKKKNKEIKSICDGEIIDIENLPDEAFASKSMGDGVGIKLGSNIICSPVDGEIKAFFETKHALMIESDDGLEILIHVGFDTVNLKGKGFEIIKGVDQRVKVGEPILKVDRKFIEEKGYITDTAIIISNMDIIEKFEKSKQRQSVSVIDTIIEYR